MLKDRSSSAIVAVRDLARAEDFYRNILRLTPIEGSPPGVRGFATGATRVIVYESPDAGSNRANAVVWDCGAEIDAIVAELEARDVAFEHYPQLAGARLEGNIHVAGSMKMVWFKDPDGNILHLNNM